MHYQRTHRASANAKKNHTHTDEEYEKEVDNRVKKKQKFEKNDKPYAGKHEYKILQLFV